MVAQVAAQTLFFALVLAVPSLLLEFYGDGLTNAVWHTLNRLRATIRKRWQSDRTDEEYRKIETGLKISLAVVGCIFVLLVTPSDVFLFLLIALAIFFPVQAVVSTCRSAHYKAVWITPSTALYGLIMGYLLG